MLQEFELILKKATEKKASDIHLKAGLPAIVRVNGNLYYLAGDEAGENVPRLTVQQLRDFAEALLGPHQRERYEAGDEVDLGYELQGRGRFRINLCQQRGNPRMVCRHIPDHIRGFDELHLPPVVQELTQFHRGLILVTGATGSGKSTTLAAMIDHIARTRSCHIVTIEDPIEFSFKDRKSIVTQREVGIDTKSFSTALKYSLRQDPDVILVGEMRDEETIMMALSAAETGHLVLSTLHTVDASETVNRILGVVESQMAMQVRTQLASVLVGVISQRLLKRKDGKGRITAVEILISNQRVKDMIQDPHRTGDICKAIEESQNIGMQTFDQSIMKLYKDGLISREEALYNCRNIQDFQMRLDGVVGGDWNEANQPDMPVSRTKLVKEMIDNGSNSVEIPIEIETTYKTPKK